MSEEETSKSVMDAVDQILPTSFVLFDIETTGFDPQRSQVCEIAALRVEGMEVTNRFDSLVHIDFPMPKRAGKVNHITDYMLTVAPHATEACRRFIRFIGEDAVLAGHNIDSFDIPFMERVAGACGLKLSYSRSADTLPIARKVWRGERHGMDALRKRLGISDTGAHRALKDCEDELEVYKALREALLALAETVTAKAEESASKQRADSERRSIDGGSAACRVTPPDKPADKFRHLGREVPTEPVGPKGTDDFSGLEQGKDFFFVIQPDGHIVRSRVSGGK